MATDARVEISTPSGTRNARRAATSYSARANGAGPVDEVLGGSSSNVVSIAGFGVGRTFDADELPVFLTAPRFRLDLDLRVTAVADCEAANPALGTLLFECSTRVSGTYGGPVTARLAYVYDRPPVVPPAPVPLPAGLPLLAGALAGLMGLRRLTRRAG